MTAGNQLTAGRALVGEVVQTANGSNAITPRTEVVTMTAATGNAGALSWANPTGAPIVVTSLIVDISVASGTATTIDAGIDADGTGTSDTLIDGQTTAAVNAIGSGQGTNGRLGQNCSATEYITGSITGTIGSFAAKAYITYVPASL